MRASRSFFYGNYDDCVRDLVDSLQINSEYEESRSLLVRAYSRAVKVHEGRIRQIKKSNERFMWDMVASEYRRLIKLNEIVHGLSTSMNGGAQQPMSFEIEDFTRQLDEANINAAETHYQEGAPDVLSDEGQE